ncbi:MAG: Nitroreductase family protein, partial [uncultured Friedmanniella sp.]
GALRRPAPAPDGASLRPGPAGSRGGTGGRADCRAAGAVGRVQPGGVAAGAHRAGGAGHLLGGDGRRTDPLAGRPPDRPRAGGRVDQPGGLPGPLRRAGQGLVRPGPGALVGAVLVRRRGDGGHVGSAERGRRRPRSLLLRRPADPGGRRPDRVRGARGPVERGHDQPRLPGPGGRPGRLRASAPPPPGGARAPRPVGTATRRTRRRAAGPRL